ncbi:DUF1217 domain-containing protein [Gluconobacter wancherniae]|uniref:Flagellar basal body rod protein FlgF n=1 Tax=Gluconobacter wancherniae NBRC 103581 TaxID=656744 RepID=A0A511AZ19_9PROT|nr:DUF1217 domain-containing protein [Gluconobacter wancherniae]MBF0853611.1 DUF1217 domain-containing protein [Gluconobacter wancherniae]MBS1063167.1 DUF1217 domain-containing protein [Gluconobacter wancherniae]GBD55643.1 flagellar basal body rod protein FlgF [Gluconobacter wancherniae NBRC 103581]GEK93454.1 flagellar basal body rod protein FlgF [Gluconobacter wancherniae NBRC 103581]
MSSSISAMPAIPQYLTAVKNETKAVSNWEKTSTASQQALKAFNSEASSITTPEQLLKNYKVLTVVLGSFGMSSAINQTAVLKSLMTEDPTSSKSLAQRSGNTAWKAFATAFSDWSTSPLSSQTKLQSISDNYLTNSYETAVQTETPGLGDALYFTRTVKAGATLESIMADPKLLKVAETVSGFDPTQFGALDYDQQVRLLEPRLKLSNFSTTAGVQRYAEQYLAMLQINPQTTTTPASTLTLYGADSSSDGILSLFTGSSSSSSSSLFSALL